MRWVALGLLFLVGCGESTPAPVASSPADTPTVPVELPPRIGTAAIELRDVTLAAGVGTSPAGGLAFIDFNDDGLPDLVVAAPDQLRLFQSLGDGRFRDVGHLLPPGIGGSGVVAADIEDDGDLDLLVTHHAGPTRLLISQPPSGFVVAANTSFGEYAQGAAFGDADQDGDLDLFLALGRTPDTTAEKGAGGAPNQLWLNDSGHFSEHAAALGVAGQSGGESWQPLFADLDGDGDLDLFVGNDVAPDAVYLNRGPDQPFEDASHWLSLGDTELMGLAIADFNGDARLDVYATDLPRDKLLLGTSAGFEDVFADRLDGPDPTIFRTGWGSALADLDSDGDLDLVAVASFDSEATPPRDGAMYVMETELGRFHDITDTALKLGPLDGHGLATADYDRDGDLDVAVVGDAGGPQHRGLVLLRNDGLRAQGNDGLEIELRQSPPNARAVGAQITAAGTTRVVTAGESFRSAHDLAVYFGLGDAASAHVTVRWPNGTTESFEQLAGQLLITRGQGATPRHRPGIRFDAPDCGDDCADCALICGRLAGCGFLQERGVSTIEQCEASCVVDPRLPTAGPCVSSASCKAMPDCFRAGGE